MTVYFTPDQISYYQNKIDQYHKEGAQSLKQKYPDYVIEPKTSEEIMKNKKIQDLELFTLAFKIMEDTEKSKQKSLDQKKIYEENKIEYQKMSDKETEKSEQKALDQKKIDEENKIKYQKMSDKEIVLTPKPVQKPKDCIIKRIAISIFESIKRFFRWIGNLFHKKVKVIN